MSCLLEVNKLTKTFVNRTGFFTSEQRQAVKPVSFSLEAGKTIALLGKNGSGKSTLAKMLAGIVQPSSGEILFNGEPLLHKDYSTRCKLIRMIFSDPDTALSPRLQIGKILNAPLALNTDMSLDARNKRVRNTLLRVGLLPEHAYLYPQMLALGQKQRVCLARALILQPSIIIADEALNGLDMAMRSQIISLLLELQDEMGISFIYVSQQIGLVKHIADQIMLIDNGDVIESGDVVQIFEDPQHEITKKIINDYFYSGRCS